MLYSGNTNIPVELKVLSTSAQMQILSCASKHLHPISVPPDFNLGWSSSNSVICQFPLPHINTNLRPKSYTPSSIQTLKSGLQAKQRSLIKSQQVIYSHFSYGTNHLIKRRHPLCKETHCLLPPQPEW